VKIVRRNRSMKRGEQHDVRARLFRPKTKSGTRRIRIPVELVAALKTWKLRCPASAQGLVFPSEHGKPLHLTTVLKRWFYPALRRAEVRQLGLKALRHGHASATLAAGASITEVAARLGHANPSITLAVYAHWIKGTPTSALADLARAITAPARSRRRANSAVDTVYRRAATGSRMVAGSPSQSRKLAKTQCPRRDSNARPQD
jgi:integrase